MYRYTKGDTDIHPHLLMGTLRNLRNAAVADPAHYWDRLERELGFVMSKVVTRGSAMVFEDPDGMAQGMPQTEYALFFISIAKIYAERGSAKTAEYYFQVAIGFMSALDQPAERFEGGIKSATITCGPKHHGRACWWFHSRADASEASETPPGTALNQMLHVLRDTMSFYVFIRDYKGPLPIKRKSRYLAHLEDLVTGGLYQLAYGPGGRHVAPSLAQFMDRNRTETRSCPNNVNDGTCYYFSAYQFDIAHGQNQNIKSDSVCHYHTHTLSVAASLFDLIEKQPFPAQAKQAAADLLAFKNKHGRAEPVGQSGSTHALYQFYRSEIDPVIKYQRQGCPVPKNAKEREAETLPADALSFFKSHYGV